MAGERAAAAQLITTAARHILVLVLVLDGEPGPWLPASFEVIAQRGESG